MNPITQLENLPGMISEDKGSILLVAGGLKPSALAVVQGDVFSLSKNPIHVSVGILDSLRTILSSFGLRYLMTTEILENASGKSYPHGQEVVRVFIAKDESVAKKLKEAFDDIKNHHAEAGLLLGYPPSAVEAFLTEDMLDWKDHPVSTSEVSELNMRILGHRLSKDNWREEVKYLEESGNYIKSQSTVIYEEITKQED